MKVLFGLCLMAVVVRMGETGNKLYCKPNYCVVKNWDMCKCGKDGLVENAKCTGVPYCYCTPGQFLNPAGLRCICPDCGLLRASDCVPEIRGSGARRRASHSDNIFHEFKSSYQHLPNTGY